MEIRHLDPQATGKRIRELRMQHKLTVMEFSSLLGLESEQAVYKWQRGDSMPTLDNLVIMSSIFDTKLDDIIRKKVIKEESECSLPFLWSA